MKITVTVCDVCEEAEKPTETYELKKGTQKARVDLCEAHRQPIEALLTLSPRGGASGPRKATQTRKPRQARVATIEEIERLKGK